MEVDSASLNHIDAVINKGKADAWRFTGIYGFPKACRKAETWELLRGLIQKFSLPWICAGDFNEILRNHEKVGGAPRRQSEMNSFRDIVDECGFVDLGFVGHKFTWRGRRPGGVVLERLDHAFASNSWLEKNPATRVQHIRAHLSDQNPIIIKPEGIIACRNKLFRFEQMWLKEDGCGDTVKAVWEDGSAVNSMQLVAQKIEKCGIRYKRNKIHELKNNDNEWCTSDNLIAEIVVRFYESLFTSSQPSDMQTVLEAIEPKVIMDNILMAFETLHYMKHHQLGKTCFMALKLDMSKAYNQVEWGFMEGLLQKMGFHERWIALMMECITTVSYSEKNGFYAWRSILKGREVIMRGMRWRIGDGNSVRIYHDKWLPATEHGRVFSPVSNSNSEALVSTLIDHETCSWREAEVDRLFLPMEASIIKAIPLSFSNRCDTIFWPRNHDEVYFVKSGYKLLMEMECGNGAASSSSSMGAMKSTWNGIWKLEVPNRIRLLLWRAGNDSLPTRVNLAGCKMSTETTCSLCNLEPEDTLHALWKCPLLSTIWQVAFADLVADTNNVSDFLNIIQRAQQDRSHFGLFAWTTSLI
ncbi:uncharacterized protein LOC142639793 [Castanea sativa]|uniref:uncharacterized protein LOC142639793 n=1 Tax=Castanea sativa TaxID=21020 RepID=UPI003F6510A0